VVQLAAYPGGVNIQYRVITVLCSVLWATQLSLLRSLQLGTEEITAYTSDSKLVGREPDPELQNLPHSVYIKLP